MTAPNDMRHLTEEERQGVADGSLAADRADDVATHLATCDACGADVARLMRLMSRLRTPVPPMAMADDFWPAIRANIEQRKVIPLAPPAVASPAAVPAPSRRRWLMWVGAGAAAAVLLVAGALVVRRAADRTAPDDTTPGGGTALIMTVADSTQVYEHEAQTLLNELELRRAMLRPATAESIDKSLRVIDQAIAELRDAVARDPNNRALRQLLASSYRQKVDLLKRTSNAS